MQNSRNLILNFKINLYHDTFVINRICQGVQVLLAQLVPSGEGCLLDNVEEGFGKLFRKVESRKRYSDCGEYRSSKEDRQVPKGETCSKPIDRYLGLMFNIFALVKIKLLCSFSCKGSCTTR